VILEIVYGTILIRSFVKTMSAAFTLRTAPIIDKKFQKMTSGAAQDMQSAREIQLGMQRFNREHDFLKPFGQSEKMLNNFRPKEDRNNNQTLQ